MLLAAIFVDGPNYNGTLYTLYLLWLLYLMTSQTLGNVLIYWKGSFSITANPTVKPGCYRWFLILYVPQLLFVLFLTPCVFVLKNILWAALALALFALKLRLTLEARRLFLSAQVGADRTAQNRTWRGCCNRSGSPFLF